MVTVMYIFSLGCFVESHFPYSSNHVLTIPDHLPVQTIYFYLLFPFVVSLWNSLPDHVIVSPLSVFKAHVSY